MKMFDLGRGLAICTTMWACSGSIGEKQEGAPDAPDETPPDGPAADENKSPDEVISQPDACQELGSPELWKRPTAGVRRLTRVELGNALSDLAGGPWQGAALPFDIDETGTHKDLAQVKVTNRFMADYWKTTEAVAGRMLSNAAVAPKCAANDAACVKTYLDTVGARAWRRPLTTEELNGLVATYDKGAAIDAGTGFSTALQRILLSPSFLYLEEDGVRVADAKGKVMRLSPYHVAEQLSFTLWSAPPDDKLRQAAKDGQLDSAESVREHAERMLADPRARDAMAAFFSEWLEFSHAKTVSKSATKFPDLTEALRADMALDGQRFMNTLLFDDNASVSQMLTSDRAFLTPRLAKFLKVTAAPSSTDAQPTAHSLPSRVGLLTTPAFLTAVSKDEQNSTIMRGAYVVERLLCGSVPAPPENVDMAALDGGFKPGLTLRERMAEHSTNPACSGCHQSFEPFGDVLEGYDPVGRIQTTDNGKPINDTITVEDLYGISGTFDGIAELAPALARAPSLDSCYVSTLAEHVLGRNLSESSACLVFDHASLGKKDAGPQSMKSLLLALVSSPAFLERQALAQENP